MERSESFKTLSEMIDELAVSQTQHAALIQDTRQLSYAELDAMMDRVAAALQRDEIAPGESIAICAATSLEYAVVFLGALRAGVAVAPIAPSSTPESIAGMIADSGAHIFFADAEVSAALEGVRGSIAAAWVALDGTAHGRAFSDWLAPEGADPKPAAITP